MRICTRGQSMQLYIVGKYQSVGSRSIHKHKYMSPSVTLQQEQMEFKYASRNSAVCPSVRASVRPSVEEAAFFFQKPNYSNSNNGSSSSSNGGVLGAKQVGELDYKPPISRDREREANLPSSFYLFIFISPYIV